MVSRRRILRLGSLALASLTGCLGRGSGDGTNTPTETTNDAESTPTGTPTPPDGSVIDYGSLSAKQQETFDRARTGTVRFSTGVPGLDKPIHYGLGVFTPFREHDYVRKDGTYYELVTGRSGMIGGRRVGVKPIGKPEDETAVHLENESGDGVELLKRAIETDGEAAHIRVDLPGWLTTGTIVEYRGNYYRVTKHQIVDYEYFTLEVEERRGYSSASRSSSARRSRISSVSNDRNCSSSASTTPTAVASGARSSSVARERVSSARSVPPSSERSGSYSSSRNPRAWSEFEPIAVARHAVGVPPGSTS